MQEIIEAMKKLAEESRRLTNAHNEVITVGPKRC